VSQVGRSHLGHQVFGFGGVSVVVDSAQNMVRAQLGERWVPMSLEGLLAEQRKRGG
jgi:tuftelin-interacting protein 11